MGHFDPPSPHVRLSVKIFVNFNKRKNAMITLGRTPLPPLELHNLWIAPQLSGPLYCDCRDGRNQTVYCQALMLSSVSTEKMYRQL